MVVVVVGLFQIAMSYREPTGSQAPYNSFKNPRTSSEIRTLAQQLTPGSLDLIDIYTEATKDPFSYLFINLTQECQSHVKYLSSLFDSDNSVKVYVSQ